jgi:hypothetical protein
MKERLKAAIEGLSKYDLDTLTDMGRGFREDLGKKGGPGFSRDREALLKRVAELSLKASKKDKGASKAFLEQYHAALRRK